MNKLKLFMRMLILLLVLAGCQSHDRSAHLVLVNTTNAPVYYYVTCDSSYQDLAFNSIFLLKPHESVRPYLLYGAEGEGPNKNTWNNAINLADDSALHVFFYYIDFEHRPRPGDSLFRFVIRRFDYKAGTLDSLGWRLTYK